MRPSRRLAAALVAAVVLVTACGEAGSVTLGPPAEPPVTTGEARVSAVRAPSTTVPATTTTIPPATTTTTIPPTTTTTTIPPTTTTVDPAAPVVLGSVVTDPRLFLLSDSVMGALGYTQQAKQVLGGLGWKVTLDFEESRSTPRAAAVARQRRGDIGQVVVVQVGNNYGGDQAAFGEHLRGLLAALDGVDEVVLLTVQEFRPDRTEVNAEIRAVAAADPERVTLLDWNAAAQADPTATARDGLLLSPAGARLMAELIGGLVGPAPVTPPPTSVPG
jgi:hypothetical protein